LEYVYWGISNKRREFKGTGKTDSYGMFSMNPIKRGDSQE
jgi:hypothetical protein